MGRIGLKPANLDGSVSAFDDDYDTFTDNFSQNIFGDSPYTPK
jgi:hypothetical protein